tara:strand:- start:10 stop:1488 length:1479 start_codon:yes stop_codon:yes gene_type:complete
MARTTIRTEDVTDSEVTTAKMATDPTNASNLSSGSVPLAQLGNVDTTAIVANQDDIALLGFKVAANGSLARYNLVDQSIDAFEDASGVDASASTDEVRDAAGNYYSGQGVAPTGGTEDTYSTYTSHTFLADGDFVIGAGGGGTLDYFIVAGGGAGGGYAIAGGGGAGGYLTGTGHSVVAATTYPVVVGDGGIWNNNEHSNATSKNGGNSTALGYTAIGGGGGGSGSGGTPAAGGSGGGAMAYSGTGGAGTAGPPRQGYAGGNPSSPAYGAGGGGGASEVGATPPQGEGGDGGDGVQSDYRSGVNVYYAGGGGGARHDTGSGGTGGQGGGGKGREDGSSDGQPGTDGLGGGGGGTSDSTVTTSPPPNGGSGIAIFRYTTGSLSAYNDMTLISNAQTAQSAPTNGDLVITYTDGAGTAVVNTDIKAYISRDGSAYSSAVTLAAQGTTGGHTILTANGVDLSGITSGTSMRWKIETLNQSAAKSTRIHAVSLGWS